MPIARKVNNVYADHLLSWKFTNDEKQVMFVWTKDREEQNPLKFEAHTCSIASNVKSDKDGVDAPFLSYQSKTKASSFVLMVQEKQSPVGLP